MEVRMRRSTGGCFWNGGSRATTPRKPKTLIVYLVYLYLGAGTQCYTAGVCTPAPLCQHSEPDFRQCKDLLGLLPSPQASRARNSGLGRDIHPVVATRCFDGLTRIASGYEGTFF